MSDGEFAEVIGDPVAHAKSPLIHNFWLGKLGIAAEYRACHVLPGEVRGYVAGRRADPAWRGCNVTVPHKESVIALVDRIDADAESVGALNTLVRGAVHGQSGDNGEIVGYNTDVIGIREALAGIAGTLQALRSPTTRVVVIGAGGAARAAGAALRGCDIGFYNRDVARAEKLAAAFSQRAARAGSLDELAADLAGGVRPAILVNASTLGMIGNPDVPLQLSRCPADTIVFDMVYAPLETGLLRQARACGMRTVDGLAMLIGQAASAFELFFGQSAPRQYDGELRNLLSA